MRRSEESVDSTGDRPSLARTGRTDERRPGFRAAGLAASRIAGPIIARQGGGILGRLKSDWPAIVGPEFAAWTWPETLARGGTLRLRVAPARGLEVQHRIPALIERINLFFGREAVTRLTLMQGPLPLRPLSLSRAATRPLVASEATALDRQLDDVADPELRDALAQLGRAVIASSDR
jgi:hypothetical protein